MVISVRNECSFSKVDSVYLPIVEDVCELVPLAISSEKFIETRLLGSVARGEARLRESDIDFVVVTSQVLSDSEMTKIGEIKGELSQKYKQVRSVDIEVETKGQIEKGRNFILSTDSICVIGRSQYETDAVEIDSIEIANQNTPDLERLIADYREGVTAATTSGARIQYSRWIGKDILKSFRYRLLVNFGIYEKSPKKIHGQLAERFPEYRDLCDSLLRCYLEPSDNVDVLLAILVKVYNSRGAFVPKIV